ncbi:MAG: dockerin type I repeat-containing protein [Muribaculaceae bacterium]|nr:dockerin type I repeat-containing protein [Muribaculaceae bacterium]
MNRLVFVVAMLLPMLAQALPFVPTTHPGVKPVHYYFLKTGGRFIYASQSDYADIAVSSSSQNNDSYYWCFVGDANSGYRIYNRATGKYLYSGEFLGDYYESSIDLVETRDNNSFYIYAMFNSGTLKNYLCYNTSNGFYTTMGKDSYFTVSEAFVEEGPTESDFPDIKFETFNEYCLITAEGTGEVHLYIDEVEVENPYSIARTNKEQKYTARATNQEPGKEMTSATMSIVVPMLDNATPDPNPNPTWTRYDANGVGYSYEYGGQGAPGYEASMALDNNAYTYYVSNPGECYVVMQASQDVAVKQYSLVNAVDSYHVHEYMLRSWKLEGSNDFKNWTEIDTQKDYPMLLVDYAEIVIPVNDTRKFRYFKFTCTEGVNNQVRLSEIWINEQNHSQWTLSDFESSSCGVEGKSYYVCKDCNVKRTELREPDGNHWFSDGVCTRCGIKEGEIRLIYNSQRVPHFVKAKHDYRKLSGKWPSAPEGWNTEDFNDDDWMDLPLATASPGHTNGPRTPLYYYSFWYGEYNCYWMRFPVNLTAVASDATFTFNCVHDDNMVVYVNGQEVIKKSGWCETPYGSTWNNTHESYNIPASAFHRGKNVVAVYIQQNKDGAYFDCSLEMNPGSSTNKGDVNGDGKVDIEDVNAVINIMLDLKTRDDYPGNADLIEDGKVDVEDMNAIINIILTLD